MLPALLLSITCGLTPWPNPSDLTLACSSSTSPIPQRVNISQRWPEPPSSTSSISFYRSCFALHSPPAPGIDFACTVNGTNEAGCSFGTNPSPVPFPNHVVVEATWYGTVADAGVQLTVDHLGNNALLSWVTFGGPRYEVLRGANPASLLPWVDTLECSVIDSGTEDLLFYRIVHLPY